MTPTPRVWSGVTLAAALLAACSTPEKTKTPPPASAVMSPGQRQVTVSETNAGASVMLESTQELSVRLVDAPTSGLEWSLVDLKPGVLALMGSRFERVVRHDNNDDGSSGVVVWRFTPQAPGVVTLNFALRRPHSLLPAVQTITYDVSVK
jgi:predicted secreted protein